MSSLNLAKVRWFVGEECGFEKEIRPDKIVKAYPDFRTSHPGLMRTPVEHRRNIRYPRYVF
jgi:hypothetical protein